MTSSSPSIVTVSVSAVYLNEPSKIMSDIGTRTCVNERRTRGTMLDSSFISSRRVYHYIILVAQIE